MVELPFSTGVVAAFLFLVYEIVVFPVLSYSTCVLAAILIYPYARKGNQVLVRSIKFPLWSEGLLHRPCSHLFILAIRVMFVVFPVLLGLELESRPALVPTTFRYAYVPQPKENESYSHPEVNPFRTYALNYLDVYHRCSWVDEHGWRKASLANISYGINGEIKKIECIESTENTIFRSAGITAATNNSAIFNKRQQIDLRVSWLDFPEKGRDGFLYSTRLFQVKHIGTMTANNTKCFVNSKPEINDGDIGKGLIHVLQSLVCQKQRAFTVDYFFTESCDVLEEFTRSRRNTSSLRKGNSLVRCWLLHVETLEFEDNIIITAKHISDKVYLFGDDRTTTEFRRTFYAQMPSLLYSRADNVTLELPSTTESRTVISDKWVIIASIQVWVTLFFGLVMYVYVLYARQQQGKEIQLPNTVNGLSEIWSISKAISEQNSMRLRKSITLKRGDIEGEEQMAYIPTGGPEP